MKLSICIAQYNRALHLKKVLESIAEQRDVDIEVIISDDCSTDNTREIIPGFIRQHQQQTSRVAFVYLQQPRNQGYDRNLRAALKAATGDYLLILGNDDALAFPDTASALVAELQRLNQPDVILTNMTEYANRQVVHRRVSETKVLGSGPELAVKVYRSFSCVCGLCFRRAAFESHDTDLYDHSVYYQIYLGCKIIAAGGTMATVDQVVVAKDVKIEGQKTNSYRDVLADHNNTLKAKTGGLDQVARCACEAILPHSDDDRRQSHLRNIYQQLYTKSYPYWLHDFRRLGVYRAALNLAIGCWPPRMTSATASFLSRMYIGAVYGAVTVAGLTLPVMFLGRLRDSIRSK